MHLFINDKPVRIIHHEDDVSHSRRYNAMLDGDAPEIGVDDLLGHVLVVNATPGLVRRVLTLLRTKKLTRLESVTFSSADEEGLKRIIKSQFRIVKAAGGVVTQDDRILLMYRMGKWDLPKGKLEKGERSAVAAVREVEEECGVKVQLEEKICATWHTYTQNRSGIIKRTKWYRMNCLNSSKMQPQHEEGIEELRWVTPAEAEALLAQSYASIRFVLERFLRQKTASGIS